MTIPFTLTNDAITVIIGGKTHNVRKTATNYRPLRQAIMEENWDEVPKHLTVAKSIKHWARGEFTYDEGTQAFRYRDQELPASLNARIVGMAGKSEDPTPLLKFWERLQKNPSYRSVQQLWRFLEHRGIPFTPSGTFLAYKGVTSDLKDAHSRIFDNSPGSINKMDRNRVSDDPRTACHEGFHVGDLSYAQSFSQRVVVCEVDPANVVAVPYDESDRKMRVCEYKVIGLYGDKLLSSTVVDTADIPEPEESEFTDDTKNQETLRNKSEAHIKEKKAKKGKMPAKFTKYMTMASEELLACSLEDLRTLATKALHVVGASKVPGGKAALVAKIIDARDGGE